jgi:hypothetical protein
MLLSECCSGSLLEYLHFDPPYVSTNPFIEDGAEKSAPEFNQHREWADATFGVRLRLDHRQKAHVGYFDLFEETVHVRGFLDIMRIDNTEDIAIDPVLSQEFIPMYCFLVSGIAVFGDSAAVMQFLGTVQTEPDNKALRRKKSAPFLVEESPIGLHAVCNTPVRGFVLALQRHNPAKVVQSQHGWFTAMPRKADQRFGASVNVLDNILFQDVVGHPKRLAPWIELFLLIKVVAIVAIQITDGAGWLGEDLKLTRSSGQICVFL